MDKEELIEKVMIDIDIVHSHIAADNPVEDDATLTPEKNVGEIGAFVEYFRANTESSLGDLEQILVSSKTVFSRTDAKIEMLVEVLDKIVLMHKEILATKGMISEKLAYQYNVTAKSYFDDIRFIRTRNIIESANYIKLVELLNYGSSLIFDDDRHASDNIRAYLRTVPNEVDRHIEISRQVLELELLLMNVVFDLHKKTNPNNQA